MPLIFVICFCRFSSPHPKRCPRVAQELLAFLIKAYYRKLVVVWPLIDLKHIKHPLLVLRGDEGDAPHFFPPGLDIIAKQDFVDRCPPNGNPNFPVYRLGQ